MVTRCKDLCPRWIKIFSHHQLEILSLYENYADLSFPLTVEIYGRNENQKLRFVEIAITKQEELENVTCFSLTSLLMLIESVPESVDSWNLSLGHIVNNVLKCSNLVGRIPALDLISKYLEINQGGDTLTIFTRVMEHSTSLFQNYQSLVLKDRNYRDCYQKGLQECLNKFCDTICNRTKTIKFQSTKQHKIFFLISLDAIFFECKFTKETGMDSLIWELVQTVDFIMFKSNFTEEIIGDTLSVMIKRFSYEVGDVFPLLKYGIVLELEKATRFDCKVTALSKVWKKLHTLLTAKSTSLPPSDVSEYLLWLFNAIDTACQTSTLFTRRHQLDHLKNTFCKRCYLTPKLPYTQPTMKFEAWTYDHINLDFFEDLKALAKNIIERISQIEITDNRIMIIMNIFATMLELSIDASSNALSDEQKVYMLSVIFLPFYITLETNEPYKTSPELPIIRRSLTANLKSFLKNTISKKPEFYARMKLTLIKHMSQMRLSKMGSIASWLGMSVAQHFLNKEPDEQVREAFILNFTNVLISNADSMPEYLEIYRKFEANFTKIKSHLCLMNKDVIIIQQKSLNNYEVFCRSCRTESNNFKTATDEVTRLTISMDYSSGIIISIDKVNLISKFRVDYHSITNSQGSHQHLIQSLEACIRHDNQFPNLIKGDNGEALLEVLLKLDAEILFRTEVFMDGIIKSIIESSNIERDLKIKFFENLRKQIIKLAPQIQKITQNEQIYKHFVGILGAYGINVKNIPSDRKTFFRSDFLAAESFKLITHFLFGEDRRLIGHAVNWSDRIFKENGMTFQQAIHMYRKVLLPYICMRVLSDSIKRTETFYEIMKNVSFVTSVKA